MKLKLTLCAIAIVALRFLAPSASAQILLGTSYSENFDTMGTTTSTYPTGWSGGRASGTGTTTVTLTTNNLGNPTSGSPYNNGASSASTDRALGSLSSGTTIVAFGAFFQNNTGLTITDLTFAGIQEQWKSGSNATVNENWAFQYSFNATSVIDGAATWTAFTGMDLNEILTSTTTAAAVNGTTSGNFSTLTGGTVSGLTFATGTNMYIRWLDADNTGTDAIMAIDDFSIAAITAGVPEPSTFVLFFGGILGMVFLKRRYAVA